ncbi:MAG: hypothetical protein IJB32_00260 [Clostridia bacterium]|nr:hypothetical protein [Clostridia bacterium]
MRSKVLIRLVVLMSVIIFGLSILGVFASWTFAEKPASNTEHSLGVELKDFFWKGVEELPDDVEGEDHEWLIRNLVMGVNASGTKIGLNNKNSKLNDYVNDRLDGGVGWERDYFGSMAVTGGNEVEDLFGTKGAGLSFIIEVISNTEYYIYTTSVYLGERGEMNFWGTQNKTPGKPTVPIGEYIYAVYKTKLSRANSNSDWNIVSTIRGKAKSDWYDENRRAANATQIPSFDVKTWVAAEMGQSPTVDNAIWTFVGDNPTAYATNSMPKLYYRITPLTSATVTVYTENLDGELKILSNNGSTVIASGSQQTVDGVNCIAVSWTATQNTLYYIEVTGDSVIQFNIK